MKALARQIMRASFGHAVKVAQIHTEFSAVVSLCFNFVHRKKRNKWFCCKKAKKEATGYDNLTEF